MNQQDKEVLGAVFETILSNQMQLMMAVLPNMGRSWEKDTRESWYKTVLDTRNAVLAWRQDGNADDITRLEAWVQEEEKVKRYIEGAFEQIWTQHKKHHPSQDSAKFWFELGFDYCRHLKGDNQP